MATIIPATKMVQHGVCQVTWSALGNADTGQPEFLARFPQKSCEISGTFGTATCVLEGSDDGATWFTMKDVTGATISVTAAARFDVQGNPNQIRARTSGGGGGVAVTAILTGKTFGN